MTMPFERTRALRWAHEGLSEICGDVALAHKYRAKAAELLRTYPSPAMVSQWIGGDVTCIPADAAAAIEETGALMRSIRTSTSCSEQMRRSLDFTLRHFPQPETARRWAESSAAWTITTWLLPEDHYDRR